MKQMQFETRGDAIDFILTEMFKRVGREYSRDIIKQKNWFLSSEWSQGEQDEFIKWMVDEICNNSSLKKIFRLRNKNNIRAGSLQFVMNYGWKHKDDE
jgi:hypothetical protein